MKGCFWLLLMAAVSAAPQDPLSGQAFRFAHLAYGGDAGVPASGGGVLRFEAEGAARWGEAPARYELTGPHEGTLTAGDTKLTFRFNQAAGVLLASAALLGGRRHHLLAAVRAPEGVSPLALRGEYGVAAMSFARGAQAGLATAFARWTLNGSGPFAKAVLAGHAAGIDDVNRGEARDGQSCELAADGTGMVRLGAGSDVLNGDWRVAVSGDGAVLLGWSADPANPGIALGVRQTLDAAVFSFHARYWLAELAAENSFVFGKPMRASSAFGSLRGNRIGAAAVSEFVLADGKISYLATVNPYRFGTGGVYSLGAPQGEAGVANFAFNETAFVSAHIGGEGQLSLGHGIAFGVAAPLTAMSLAPASAPVLDEAPLVAGARMSLGGLAPDAKVRIDGVEVQAAANGQGRLEFTGPALRAGKETSLIEAGQGSALRVRRAASSPSIYTASASGMGVASAKPVAPGDTVTFTVTGIGAVGSNLRVLFDGVAGALLAAPKAIDGEPGKFELKAVVPREVNVPAGATRDVPVALVTPDSFIDLAEVTVARPAPPRQ